MSSVPTAVLRACACKVPPLLCFASALKTNKNVSGRSRARGRRASWSEQRCACNGLGLGYEMLVVRCWRCSKKKKTHQHFASKTARGTSTLSIAARQLRYGQAGRQAGRQAGGRAGDRSQHARADPVRPLLLRVAPRGGSWSQASGPGRRFAQPAAPCVPPRRGRRARGLETCEPWWRTREARVSAAQRGAERARQHTCLRRRRCVRESAHLGSLCAQLGGV